MIEAAICTGDEHCEWAFTLKARGGQGLVYTNSIRGVAWKLSPVQDVSDVSDTGPDLQGVRKAVSSYGFSPVQPLCKRDLQQRFHYSSDLPAAYLTATQLTQAAFEADISSWGLPGVVAPHRTMVCSYPEFVRKAWPDRCCEAGLEPLLLVQEMELMQGGDLLAALDLPQVTRADLTFAQAAQGSRSQGM